jgi:hypothetical protein
MELVLKLFTTLIKRSLRLLVDVADSLHWKNQLGAGLIAA